MATLERSKSDVPARPSFMRKIGAGAVLVAAVTIGLYLAVHIIIGLFTAVFTIALVIAVALAVLWAVKTIVW
jgi:hypothetical protein